MPVPSTCAVHCKNPADTKGPPSTMHCRTTADTKLPQRPETTTPQRPESTTTSVLQQILSAAVGVQGRVLYYCCLAACCCCHVGRHNRLESPHTRLQGFPCVARLWGVCLGRRGGARAGHRVSAPRLCESSLHELSLRAAAKSKHGEPCVLQSAAYQVLQMLRAGCCWYPRHTHLFCQVLCACCDVLVQLVECGTPRETEASNKGRQARPERHAAAAAPCQLGGVLLLIWWRCACRSRPLAGCAAAE